jgi:hypothetical protein
MKNQNKLFFWTPRILGIIFVLFLIMFSLDVFQPGLNAWQITVGLFMHNIPALLLLIVLLISWRYEMVGGIIFILAGLFCILMLSRSIIIFGPAFLIGILFTINWYKNKFS